MFECDVVLTGLKRDDVMWYCGMECYSHYFVCIVATRIQLTEPTKDPTKEPTAMPRPKPTTGKTKMMVYQVIIPWSTGMWFRYSHHSLACPSSSRQLRLCE